MSSITISILQLLKILKQQIDAELPVSEESLELVDNSRFELIDREQRLVNARKNAIEGSKNGSNISATTPPQLTPSSSYDPFKRGDTKRKSFSSSLSNIFKRPPNSSGISIFAHFSNFVHTALIPAIKHLWDLTKSH